MSDPSTSGADDDDRRADRVDRASGASGGGGVGGVGGGADAPFTDPTARLHDHLRAARSDFEEANERIKQRTGRDLILAILIGLAIGAALLLSLLIWKYAFILLAAAAAVLGTLELGRALRESGRRIDTAAQLIGMAVLLVCATFLATWLVWLALVVVIVLVVVWRLIAQMAARDRRPTHVVADDVLAGALIPLYVGLTASLCVILLRQSEGQWWVLAFIIIAVASDTGAYASGLTLGRHPMAPRISPKKTWEGFAGAVLAAAIAGVLLALFMLHVPWWAGLLFGLVILCTATIGDLGESMIKRDLGIKDMSSWLPGHGGVLDRLDSILPSAVAALALYLFLSPLVIPA